MTDNPWAQMSVEDARAYDQRKEHSQSAYLVQIKRGIILSMMKKYLPRRSTLPILDLVGGTGIWAIPLARMGYRVILGDISESFLAVAQEKIAHEQLTEMIECRCLDMVDLSCFPDNAFGLVLALGDPLSYCSDFARAVEEIYRVLAPTRYLVGDVENKFAGINARRAHTWSDVKRILETGEARWGHWQQNAAVHQFDKLRLEQLFSTRTWQLLHLYPSDLIVEMIGDEFLNQLIRDENGTINEKILQEMTRLETRLRTDSTLLGTGAEIQFVVKKV